MVGHPRQRHPALLLLLGTTAGLALTPFLELPPDVAYYGAWSRHLQPAYLDHPGGVAWLLAWVPDAHVAAALRAAPIVCALAQVAVVGLLLHWARAPRWASVAVAASPLWLAGPLLWTPDAPLLLAWHAGLLVLATGRGRAWLVPLAAAMAASKIVGVWLAAVWLAAAWRDPAGRRWALLAVAAAALTLALTGLPSLAFQLERAAGGGAGGGLSWSGPLVALGGLLVLLGPALGLVVAAGVAVRARGGPALHDAAVRLGTVCGLGAVLPFVAVSAWVHVEANWLAPACLPLVVLALGLRADTDAAARGQARRGRWVAAAQLALAAALVALVTLAPAGSALRRPLRPVAGWSDWAARFPAGAELVLADRYQWAAELWLHRGPRPATFDALVAGAATRRSALDGQLFERDAARVLLVWSERPPPPLAAASWPAVCEAGLVASEPGWGSPVSARFELRAASAAHCP